MKTCSIEQIIFLFSKTKIFAYLLESKDFIVESEKRLDLAIFVPVISARAKKLLPLKVFPNMAARKLQFLCNSHARRHRARGVTIKQDVHFFPCVLVEEHVRNCKYFHIVLV